jgi:dCTP deaminase
MFLSANEIRAEIEAGRIGIDPYLPSLLKPASYVLRLGSKVIKWAPSAQSIRIWSESAGKDRLVNELLTPGYILPPGGFLLTGTLERIRVPEGFCGLIASLSHLARFGVCVHLNSFVISPGFGSNSMSNITLELTSHNTAPIELQPGLPVCHILFVRTQAVKEARLPLTRSIYEGLDAPSGPMLYEEFHRILGTNLDARAEDD